MTCRWLDLRKHQRLEDPHIRGSPVDALLELPVGGPCDVVFTKGSEASRKSTLARGNLGLAATLQSKKGRRIRSLGPERRLQRRLSRKENTIMETRWGQPQRPASCRPKDSYLVDSASSHMLVSKIKPCMSKYARPVQ